MKIINRGYLLVKPTQFFNDWANQHLEDDFKLNGTEEAEPNVYLIEEDFFEVEPLLEKNFKKIFKTELLMISEEEDLWPEITMDAFLIWFEIELGSTVFDTLSTTIHSEDI